jgi:peptidoglycan/LPS O-acetylase OafA/YrhL
MRASTEFPEEIVPGKNNFDALRFFFAALVIFSHAFTLSTGVEDPEPLHLFTGKITFGTVAVNAFFTISGFLITHSWLSSRSAGAYLLKRALRIYPGFIVACVLGLAVFGYLGADNPATYFASQRLQTSSSASSTFTEPASWVHLGPCLIRGT